MIPSFRQRYMYVFGWTKSCAHRIPNPPCTYSHTAALVPLSSTLIILFLVTSIFAVISVHLFGAQDPLNFGLSAHNLREKLGRITC